MLVVMIGWVFFRADTLSGAMFFLKSMAGMNVASATPFTVWFYLTPEVWLALVAGAIGSAPWIPALAARAARSAARNSWDAVAASALVAVFLASILNVAARTYNPFIYFRF
jgi:alginate O-acetyltransferase complex protein AlgI